VVRIRSSLSISELEAERSGIEYQWEFANIHQLRQR